MSVTRAQIRQGQDHYRAIFQATMRRYMVANVSANHDDWLERELAGEPVERFTYRELMTP